MMYRIPLAAVPNQRLTVRLDGALFDLTVKAGRGSMVMSILRDAAPVILGVRCLP